MDSKLSKSEALAIQALAHDPNWQKFKDYVARRNKLAVKECMTCMQDHRFHQGKVNELSELVRIEEKATNILIGT